jgi:hypothetical protein
VSFGSAQDDLPSTHLAGCIAVSPRDEIFVADTLNWRVQKYVRK